MSPFQSQSHHQESGTPETLNTEGENMLESQLLRKGKLNFKVESIKNVNKLTDNQTVNKYLL